jgi:hypothetical protein
MTRFTVIFVERSHRLMEAWQFFQCMADDTKHAEEQCLNAYPMASILRVNEGPEPKGKRWVR